MVAYFLAVLAVLSATVHCGPFCGCEQRYTVLMELFNATNGSQWTDHSGWGVAEPCSTD
jgi:hypothetical protein